MTKWLLLNVTLQITTVSLIPKTMTFPKTLSLERFSTLFIEPYMDVF